MAYEILSESYGRRLPKIAAEADSADDLATLGTNWAEGSTCVIGDKTYSLDKVQGWVEPGSGGGGGGSPYVVEIVYDELLGPKTVKTAAEVYEMYNAASQAGVPFLCGNMEGKVVDAFCEEAGDEADGDLRYVLSVFTMYFPSDSSATEMYYSYYQTAVPIADVNDHPFVFHESSYGYAKYSWTIPLTPAT